MWAYYIPLFPYFIIKGLLKRHLFYFTNANPGIDRFGGLFLDSKQAVDRLIPEQYRPLTTIFYRFNDETGAEQFVNEFTGTFPIIAKPDNGERGEGIVKINDKAGLLTYLQAVNQTYLIQEYIDFPCEYGVFIAFTPANNRYLITSLTEKKYFSVTGNGIDTIAYLIHQSERGIVFFERLQERSIYEMDFIPEQGQVCIIHTLGNHCNGTEFINSSHLIDTTMTDSFNELMKQVDGVCYGRFDIKVASFEDLKTFQNFKVIEFNGIAAEPIHIYDRTTGYFNSISTFIKHWRYLEVISNFNHSKGINPSSFAECLRKIRIKFP